MGRPLEGYSVLRVIIFITLTAAGLQAEELVQEYVCVVRENHTGTSRRCLPRPNQQYWANTEERQATLGDTLDNKDMTADNKHIKVLFAMIFISCPIICLFVRKEKRVRYRFEPELSSRNDFHKNKMSSNVGSEMNRAVDQGTRKRRNRTDGTGVATTSSQTDFRPVSRFSVIFDAIRQKAIVFAIQCVGLVFMMFAAALWYCTFHVIYNSFPSLLYAAAYMSLAALIGVVVGGVVSVVAVETDVNHNPAPSLATHKPHRVVVFFRAVWNRQKKYIISLPFVVAAVGVFFLYDFAPVVSAMVIIAVIFALLTLFLVVAAAPHVSNKRNEWAHHQAERAPWKTFCDCLAEIESKSEDASTQTTDQDLMDLYEVIKMQIPLNVFCGLICVLFAVPYAGVILAYYVFLCFVAGVAGGLVLSASIAIHGENKMQVTIALFTKAFMLGAVAIALIIAVVATPFDLVSCAALFMSAVASATAVFTLIEKRTKFTVKLKINLNGEDNMVRDCIDATQLAESKERPSYHNTINVQGDRNTIINIPEQYEGTVDIYHDI